MPKNQRHPFHAAAIMSAILSQLVGSILIGIYAGIRLDRWIKTEPLFLIVGLLLGLAVGIYSMLLLVHHYYSGE